MAAWTDTVSWLRDVFDSSDNSSSSTRVAWIAGGVVVAVTGCVILLRRRYSSKGSQYPLSTVVVHNGGKGPYAPSLVPFAVKLETYLRVIGTPYEVDESHKQSRKGKLPWIEHNGQAISDSTFCIQYLAKTFHKDINAHLTPEQVGIGRAFTKMAEENLYWTMVLFRWVYDDNFWKVVARNTFEYLLFGYVLLPLGKRTIRKMVWNHGIGRHSWDELAEIMEGDLKAISDFLGKKKYLFGDKPCEADCAVFGQLSQFMWHMPDMLGEKLVKEKYSNLAQYCLRMKEEFWPDWNQRITKPNTR